MCLQDVRLGRGRSVQSVAQDQVGLDTGLIHGTNNPNRAAYIITARFDRTLYAGECLVIRSGSLTGPALGAIVAEAPTLVLDVLTHGDAVVRPISVADQANFGIDYHVSEAVWLAPVDEVAAYTRG